jgi:hypothetical protein
MCRSNGPLALALRATIVVPSSRISPPSASKRHGFDELRVPEYSSGSARGPAGSAPPRQLCTGRWRAQLVRCPDAPSASGSAASRRRRAHRTTRPARTATGPPSKGLQPDHGRLDQQPIGDTCRKSSGWRDRGPGRGRRTQSSTDPSAAMLTGLAVIPRVSPRRSGSRPREPGAGAPLACRPVRCQLWADARASPASLSRRRQQRRCFPAGSPSAAQLS